MKQLSVGDVVFILDKNTHAVVPCQLVEIISSITIDGEKTRHVVMTPAGKKKFKLEDQSTPWFSSHRETRDYLLEAATQLIDKTLGNAARVASKSFGVVVEESDDFMSSENQEHVSKSTEDIPDRNNFPDQDFLDNNESLYVEMGGQKVKVTLPKALSNE